MFRTSFIDENSPDAQSSILWNPAYGLLDSAPEISYDRHRRVISVSEHFTAANSFSGHVLLLKTYFTWSFLAFDVQLFCIMQRRTLGMSTGPFYLFRKFSSVKCTSGLPSFRLRVSMLHFAAIVFHYTGSGQREAISNGFLWFFFVEQSRYCQVLLNHFLARKPYRHPNRIGNSAPHLGKSEDLSLTLSRWSAIWLFVH